MNATQLNPDTSHQPTSPARWLLLLSLACGGAPDGVLFADKAVPPVAGPRWPAPAASLEPAMDSLAEPLQPTSSTGSATASVSSPRPGQSSVIWSSPAQGEGGVRDDREVSLQFSEAMNIPSVEAALSSTLPGRLTLSWEGGGSLLRVKASERMAYAEGLTARPLEFQVNIGEGARALSGAPLAPSSVTFRTLRRVELLLEPSDDPELTGVALSAAAPRPDAGAAAPCVTPDSLCAGDLPDGAGDWIQVKSFLSFDLEQLPRDAQLERARLRLVVEDVVGNPFGARGLGSLHAERSWFSQIDPEAFRADPDATLAVFANGATQAESGDITWVIQEARERGVSQYRLTFPQTTNRDQASDLALFVPRRQRLELSYLIP
jgi:hypothetical protein